MIVMESLPPAMGGSPQRAHQHFQRAVELSGGLTRCPYVTLAQSVSVAAQNRAEFRDLLDKAIAIDPDRDPQRASPDPAPAAQGPLAAGARGRFVPRARHHPCGGTPMRVFAALLAVVILLTPVAPAAAQARPHRGEARDAGARRLGVGQGAARAWARSGAARRGGASRCASIRAALPVTSPTWCARCGSVRSTRAALTIWGSSTIDDSFLRVRRSRCSSTPIRELFAGPTAMGPELRRRLEAKGFVLLNWGHGGWVHFFTQHAGAVGRRAEASSRSSCGRATTRSVQMWKDERLPARSRSPPPTSCPALQTGMIDALPSPPLAAQSAPVVPPGAQHGGHRPRSARRRPGDHQERVEQDRPGGSAKPSWSPARRPRQRLEREHPGTGFELGRGDEEARAQCRATSARERRALAGHGAEASRRRCDKVVPKDILDMAERERRRLPQADGRALIRPRYPEGHPGGPISDDRATATVRLLLCVATRSQRSSQLTPVLASLTSEDPRSARSGLSVGSVPTHLAASPAFRTS